VNLPFCEFILSRNSKFWKREPHSPDPVGWLSLFSQHITDLWKAVINEYAISLITAFRKNLTARGWVDLFAPFDAGRLGVDVCIYEVRVFIEYRNYEIL
jgi:hypothetical protein